MKALDLVGQMFTDLHVVSEVREGTRRRGWLCRCKCGNTTVVSTSCLRQGGTKSCGCRHTTHGHTKGGQSKVYKAWLHMVARCCNPNDKAYGRYGGRPSGPIKVCDRWRDFQTFHEDIGDPPTPSHTLGRIDNDGDYEPNNVRWETFTEQQNNKSTTIRLTHDGVTRSLGEWAATMGASTRTLWARVNRGWTDEAIVTKPIRPMKRPAGQVDDGCHWSSPLTEVDLRQQRRRGERQRRDGKHDEQDRDGEFVPHRFRFSCLAKSRSDARASLISSPVIASSFGGWEPGG